MSAANILTTLRNEHREVVELFTTLEKTTPRSARRREETFSMIETALSRHAEFEEAHLYTLLTARKTTKSSALEAIEEHALVKHMLSELRALDMQDERWMAKAMVLMENVRHHIKEEEGELFSQLRQAVDAKQLERLAVEYEAFPTRLAGKAPAPPQEDVVPSSTEHADAAEE